MGLQDKPLDETLAGIAGAGPHPWVFVVGTYQGCGGKARDFSEHLYRYQERWPGRIIIRRGYDLSAGATIEVTGR